MIRVLQKAASARDSRPGIGGRWLGQWFWAGLLCLLFFTESIGLQWLRGAYANECGGYPDEACHFVTALMVRDYALSFQWGSPMHFAEQFYAHYPKIGIGHWPPLFYVSQAAWMTLFGESRVSSMLFMAVLSALGCGLLYHWVRGELGIAAGLAAGLLCAAVSVWQESASMVMAEIPTAVLGLLAVRLFARFAEQPSFARSTLFALAASACILTRGSGIFLVLLPLFFLVLARRFDLLRKASFYWPALVVLVTCGPWYFLFRQLARFGWESEGFSLAFTAEASGFYAHAYVKIFGFALCGLALVGIAVSVATWTKNRSSEEGWLVLLAMIISVLVFHAAVPTGPEKRFLIYVVPPTLAFAARGAAWVVSRGPLSRSAWATSPLWGGLVMVVAFGAESFSVQSNLQSGFGPVAEQIQAEPDFGNPVILVSSDDNGEGMFVAEVAQREHRPGHIVLRASNMLARSDWNGRHERFLKQSVEEVSSYLNDVPVGTVVIDTSISPAAARLRQQDLLLNAVCSEPGRWELVGRFTRIRDNVPYPESIEVYRQKGVQGRPVQKIRIDLAESLHRAIEF